MERKRNQLKMSQSLKCQIDGCESGLLGHYYSMDHGRENYILCEECIEMMELMLEFTRGLFSLQ